MINKQILISKILVLLLILMLCKQSWNLFASPVGYEGHFQEASAARIPEPAYAWKGFILKYSSKMNLKPELVFAIIHQESYFNQNARSPKGAIGLMQLMVPTGGGESYADLTGSDILPTEEILFNPKFNIIAGINYLRMLRKQFSYVKDPHKRMLLVISAYNTGVTNVEGCLQQRQDPNRLSYSQLYRYLLISLPYSETRKYLKSVVQLQDIYAAWLSD